MASRNNGRLHLPLVHLASPVPQQSPRKAHRDEVLPKRHNTSKYTIESNTTAISQKATFPSRPALPLGLQRKIERIALANLYFDWDTVAKLLKEHTQDGTENNSDSVLQLYIGRVLFSQLDRNRSVLAKIPQELWDIVMEYLPSLTGRYAAQVFNFTLTKGRRLHSEIWSKIIKEEASWHDIAIKYRLNLTLVGDNLHSLVENPEAPASLALVKGNKRECTDLFRKELFRSFKPYNVKDNEIVFKESNITLNIDGVLNESGNILCTPEKLFSYQHTNWRSASLYWRDNEHALRTIGPDDIVGIRTRGSALQDISHICGITLTHPKKMALKRRQQYIFEHRECSECRNLLDISAPGHQHNGDNHLGFERI